ncbi:MAG: YbaB/EbfC family nucleoid-associated protein [Bacilli bacterium]|nr:YbaB/EbfC family nucleoid-associated protein [Bacilli bacterium]
MNMQAILKQAQNMQKDMLKAKEEIDNSIFIGESSLVKVEVYGTKQLKSVKINTEQDIEADEIEMLEDMLMVALNSAFKEVDKLTEEKMGKYTNIPGLF